jgi:transposase
MGKGSSIRRRYSKEFRDEAVQLASEPGAVMQKVANELGVSSAVLSHWLLKSRAESGGDDMKAEMDKLREDLKLMKKRAELAEMERDILKKATAFFANS